MMDMTRTWNLRGKVSVQSGTDREGKTNYILMTTRGTARALRAELEPLLRGRTKW